MPVVTNVASAEPLPLQPNADTIFADGFEL